MKKGQGLSLNVIIVAAIALIVMVLLIGITTGRLGVFDETLDSESNTELATLRLTYGTCQPSSVAETTLQASLATSSDSEGQEIINNFKSDISRCKSMPMKIIVTV